MGSKNAPKDTYLIFQPVYMHWSLCMYFKFELCNKLQLQLTTATSAYACQPDLQAATLSTGHHITRILVSHCHCLHQRYVSLDADHGDRWTSWMADQTALYTAKLSFWLMWFLTIFIFCRNLPVWEGTMTGAGRLIRRVWTPTIQKTWISSSSYDPQMFFSFLRSSLLWSYTTVPFFSLHGVFLPCGAISFWIGATS